jgi:hypothetical protein
VRRREAARRNLSISAKEKALLRQCFFIGSDGNPLESFASRKGAISLHPTQKRNRITPKNAPNGSPLGAFFMKNLYKTSTL